MLRQHYDKLEDSVVEDASWVEVEGVYRTVVEADITYVCSRTYRVRELILLRE